MDEGGWVATEWMRSFACWDSAEDLCFNKRALLPVCMCVCSPHRSLGAQAFTEAYVEAGSRHVTWSGLAACVGQSWDCGQCPAQERGRPDGGALLSSWRRVRQDPEAACAEPRAQEPAREAQLCLPRDHSALAEWGSCSLEDKAGPGLPKGRRRLNEMGVCPQPLPGCSRLAKALVWPPGVDQSRLWAPSEVCRGLPCPGPLCPARRTCAHLRGPALLPLPGLLSHLTQVCSSSPAALLPWLPGREQAGVRRGPSRSPRSWCGKAEAQGEVDLARI